MRKATAAHKPYGLHTRRPQPLCPLPPTQQPPTTLCRKLGTRVSKAAVAHKPKYAAAGGGHAAIQDFEFLDALPADMPKNLHERCALPRGC